MAVFCGGTGGATFGASRFGWLGGILGGVAGILIGHVIGVIPDWLSTRFMFRYIAKSSDEKLWRILNLGFWNFYQTLALLQLAARGRDVRTELPRIVTMLESDDKLERVYGWDALQLVFTEEAKKVPGYDPWAATDECRQRIVELKALVEAVGGRSASAHAGSPDDPPNRATIDPSAPERGD
jgi:hypothetical protein